jgi:uncharacterized membrane protein
MNAPAAPTGPAPQALQPFDIGPITRALAAIAGVGLTTLCAIALVRIGAGAVPASHAARLAAVWVHVASVVPAVPLGAWLLLGRKGTPRHKALGKVWVALMVVAALAALFIREVNGGSLSFIHLFVPLTLFGAWRTVATARAHDIPAHKRALIRLYFGAMLIPGLLSFLPGRLMGLGLFG